MVSYSERSFSGTATMGETDLGVCLGEGSHLARKPLSLAQGFSIYLGTVGSLDDPLLWGQCVRGRTLSSIAGLYPVDIHSYSPFCPSPGRQKCLQTQPSDPGGPHHTWLRFISLGL